MQWRLGTAVDPAFCAVLIIVTQFCHFEGCVLGGGGGVDLLAYWLSLVTAAGNGISCAGAQRLAESLRANHSLTSLQLSCMLHTPSVGHEALPDPMPKRTPESGHNDTGRVQRSARACLWSASKPGASVFERFVVRQ